MYGIQVVGLGLFQLEKTSLNLRNSRTGFHFHLCDRRTIALAKILLAIFCRKAEIYCEYQKVTDVDASFTQHQLGESNFAE